MQCPACAKELVSETIDGIQLEVCDGGCGGIWFSREVLTQFDSPHEPCEGLTPPTIRPGLKVDQTRRYVCPCCNNVAMGRQFVRVLEDVLVDECPSCGGIWLHGDELEEISQQFDNESSFSAHSPITDPNENLDAREEQRNQRFQNACRFITCHHCVG